MDDFTRGYIACALWAESADYTDRSFAALGYDESDLHPEALRRITEDCADFQEANAVDLNLYEAARPLDYAGHDFWLTRNGHGAGFWDRGLGELGDRLTAASKAYGGCSLYLGDDGLIYCHS